MTELAGLLGVSKQTASRYLQCMVDEGLVVPAGHEPRKGGGPLAVVFAWAGSPTC
jgi:Fic family protein